MEILIFWLACAYVTYGLLRKYIEKEKILWTNALMLSCSVAAIVGGPITLIVVVGMIFSFDYDGEVERVFYDLKDWLSRPAKH